MKTLRFSELLEKNFIGAEDLRRELSDILERLPKEGGEIVVTQHGKPKAIIVDIKSYLDKEEFLEQVADSDPKLIKRLNKAVEDFRSGKDKGVPLEEAFRELGISDD